MKKTRKNIFKNYFLVAVIIGLACIAVFTTSLVQQYRSITEVNAQEELPLNPQPTAPFVNCSPSQTTGNSTVVYQCDFFSITLPSGWYAEGGTDTVTFTNYDALHVPMGDMDMSADAQTGKMKFTVSQTATTKNLYDYVTDQKQLFSQYGIVPQQISVTVNGQLGFKLITPQKNFALYVKNPRNGTIVTISSVYGITSFSDFSNTFLSAFQPK